MGVKEFIIVVSKMDTVNFNRKRFEKITIEMTPLLKKIGINPAKV
jgi:translation elongation factor EF-1alpha